MGDAPPPPPPPHGSAPRSSSGLPPGKYDIFVIPQHSAGSGFLYLPSMKPNVNSFIAGFASALILVAVFQSMAPAFRAWWDSFQGLGNMGITLLIIGVGFGAWALGRTQHDGPSSSSHYQSSYSGAGGGAGYTPGGFGDSASGPSSPGGQPHAGPPPRPPPHASPPPHRAGAGGGPPPQTRPQTPPPATAPPQPPPPTSQPPPTSPPPPQPQPQPQPQPPPPTSPPLTTQPPPMQEEKPKTSSQRPNPQPTTPKSPTPRGAWEKAREETRKKEEERKLKEAEQKRREEAVKRLAELRAKEAKERQEREKEKQLKEKEAHDKKLKEQAEQRRKELMEKLRREREEKAKEEEKRKEAAAAAATTAPSTPAGDNATRVGSTYAFSSVGEKTSMWPNGRPPSQAKSTPSSPTKKPPSPEKRPPNPTARSFVSTAPSDSTYSFRPYDDPKRTRRRQTSMSSLTGSDTSWAQSQTTSRTSPPPSVRGSRGPYTTKDPDKIVIQAVYLFMNEYAKTPASQLVSGVGSVTDGLILRITTEGLFIDDDVRGVPQREWDVKAWTLKLAEVWCPPHCLNSASASASATASGGAPKSAPHLLFKMATAARKAGGDRDGGNKILTGEEADSYLGDMLRTCKECCRLGLCDATLRNSSSLSAVSAGWKQKGLHVLRATIRDQEGKRYMFVMSERESWKLAYGLQRLRGGTQVRQLGVAGMTAGEARGTLEMLGWG
ncbi:hypothetical protein E4U34_003256 [Claviceps purpurea]|nr:hypothetical protein E4U38_003050 [Claviceps purpurea]KAG6219976.1 hypothetical protein E4U34_003256 [Claviceps purpurea]